jgi:hypothetical protein
LVTIVCTAAAPDAEDGNASTTMTIFGQTYCSKLTIKFKFSAVADLTSVTNINLNIKDTAWGSGVQAIQIASINLPSGYLNKPLLMRAELCTGAVADVENQSGSNVDDSPFVFESGAGDAMYWDTGDINGNPLPTKDQCP